MTTTAFDRLTAKAQRLERELREARAREARVRRLAEAYEDTTFEFFAEMIHAALDQDGDDDA